MSDGNSWCSCTRNYPHGWNKKDCPVHDRPLQYDQKSLEREEWLKEDMLDVFKEENGLDR